MGKLAIIVLSDPNSGSEEALGRLFNALATAYEAKEQGDDVTVLFQGTGTRWAGVLTDKTHPAHALYEAVKDKIAGVSCACADVFGARETAVGNGFKLVKENLVPGTSGLASIAGRLEQGYRVVTF